MHIYTRSYVRRVPGINNTPCMYFWSCDDVLKTTKCKSKLFLLRQNYLQQLINTANNIQITRTRGCNKQQPSLRICPPCIYLYSTASRQLRRKANVRIRSLNAGSFPPGRLRAKKNCTTQRYPTPKRTSSKYKNLGEGCS